MIGLNSILIRCDNTDHITKSLLDLFSSFDLKGGFTVSQCYPADFQFSRKRTLLH